MGDDASGRGGAERSASHVIAALRASSKPHDVFGLFWSIERESGVAWTEYGHCCLPLLLPLPPLHRLIRTNDWVLKLPG